MNLIVLVMINGPASREEPFFHFACLEAVHFHWVSPLHLYLCFFNLAASNKIYPDQAFADSEILET